jgi:hypothetical protein
MRPDEAQNINAHAVMDTHVAILCEKLIDPKISGYFLHLHFM